MLLHHLYIDAFNTDCRINGLSQNKIECILGCYLLNVNYSIIIDWSTNSLVPPPKYTILTSFSFILERTSLINVRINEIKFRLSISSGFSERCEEKKQKQRE